MIVLAGLIAGAGYGAWLARKRDGKRLDMLQYGAGFALAFAMLGLFITVFLDRLG